MFNTILLDLFNFLTKPYFKELKNAQLTTELGFLQGELLVENIELDCDGLAGLNLPIKFVQGHIESIHIVIPWGSFCHQSTVLEVSGILLKVQVNKDYQPPNIEEKAQSKEENQNDNTALPVSEGKQRELWFYEKIAVQLAKNLVVVVKNVHIQLEDLVSYPSKSQSLDLILNSIQLGNTDKNWFSVFARLVSVAVEKKLELQHLLVQWSSSHSPGILDQESAWSSRAETVNYQHKTLLDHQEIVANMKCIVMEDSVVQLKVTGDVKSSPINIDIGQDLISSIAGSVLIKDHVHIPPPPSKVKVDKPKIIEKQPLFPLNLLCSIAEVRLTYHSLDNDKSYSALLSGACVSVQQEPYDLFISIKLSELAMGIHGAVVDHMINTFKGVIVDVIVEPSLKVEARLSDWNLILPSLESKLYSYFPKVVAKVQSEEENIAFVQVWEDTSKGTPGTTCVLLGLHNAVLMYHQAFTVILLDQLNQNFNLLKEMAQYIPRQNLELQCPEICIGLELSSVTTYIPIISLHKTRYIQTIPDCKKHDATYLAEKHDVKVDLLDVSRYLVRNECVQFSSSCGPPLTQISGIDLLVGVFEQEDYPDYKMSDLKIEVEKFMLKGGMQFGIDLKNFIIDIKEMIIKMFFPGLNVYPGTVIEPVVQPEMDSKIGSLQKTKLGIVLKELEMYVLQHEVPFDQPRGLCDARFFAITLCMNEFYNGELNMEIAVPTWTMLDCRLTPDAYFTEPVSTNGMFSKPSMGISYQRDQNQHESVFMNVSLTRIYLWLDFLKDMVEFWIQVVPPEKDKNPEVALEKLLPEQKGKMPRMEFVLNFNQDSDIVIIESPYLTNPTTLVIKFMGLTHFELDKYTWTQNMRVNGEKIVVECNYYADIDKQCWKLVDITSFKMMAYGKPEIDPTDITFTLTHILVSLTPTSAQMLIAMIPSMIPALQDTQLVTSSNENGNLWEPQPLDTNAWYLTGEDAASMSIDSEGLSPPSVNTPKMKVILKALEVRLDDEINQKIFPAVAINCTAKAEIIDWLKDLVVSAELGLEATYYNDQLAVWEPLLEPIECSDSAECSDRTFRPWVVKAEVVKNVIAMAEMDHEKLQSSLTSATKSLARRMSYKMPEFSINITADEPLQLTLTKKCLKLIVDVAADFVTPTGAKPINQMNISMPTAPFKVVNKLGPTFEIRVTPGDTLALKGNHRYAHAANDEMLEFFYKKSKEVLQSSSLCSKPSGFLDHITINVTKVVSWSDASEVGGRRMSTSTMYPPLRSIPVTRTGKYYYSLRNEDDDDDIRSSTDTADESDFTPHGIVLEITLVKGQRVVTVRSPLQFINHTSIPLKIWTRTLVEHFSSFTREYNDIEFAAVQPDQTCAVPLIFASYSDFCIEPDIPEYSLSTHFSRISTEKTIQIDCESLLGSSNKNSLHIWLVIKEEEYTSLFGYINKLPSYIPHHTFHFYPTAYFHNLLPFDIQLTVENGRSMEEQHSISKGQNVMLSCFSLEDAKTNFIYKIEDCKDSQTIQIKKEKNFIYSFHHIRSHLVDHTLMHFDKKNTLEIYLYAPFWFINKTELTLHYRISHTKDVITHAPSQKLMLFSFGHKYEGKKAIKMRIQDSTEWSKSVSLDTAGYHGVIDIPDKFSVMKAGVKIRLTRCTLSKLVVIHPFYILVNKTKNRIICHEVGQQWLDIAPDSTKAFWPMQLERPLMDINIDGHGFHSDPFNYNIADSVLLKMKGQLQAIKVMIHITTSTHVVVFESYAHGDCPVQLVNDFKRATIEFQQVTRTGKAHIYALGPCQSLMYTWDVPHEEHMIRWWVQGERKEKGRDQLMSLEDGSGKFEMQTLRSYSSEKKIKYSTLGVPHNDQRIDVVDYSPTEDDWTMVNVRQKSSSPPPISPQNIHTRTGSFDLHTINPTSSLPSNSLKSPKKTWCSGSAQPELDTDTTPLVDFTDAKSKMTSSLHRKGAIKRSSTKHQQQLSESAGKGSNDKKLSRIGRSLSKSSSDLRDIDAQKSQKKPPVGKRSGYWVSMMDGFQRILLFTPQYSVVKNCEKANRLNFDALEVNFALKSVTVTLIDNNTNREILLLSILPRPTLWEIKQHQAGWEDVKSASLLSALEIAQSQLIPMVELDKLKVDMANMKMISPVTGDLRCTTYNAVEAQLKMGANNIFVQLKAYDIQSHVARPLLAQGVIACSTSTRSKKESGMVHSADSFLTSPLVDYKIHQVAFLQIDNQLASRVYSTPLYTEVCNKPENPESTGENWFLNAGILLKRDRNGIITKLDYLNASLQPIHLRTDVGLVLALMDMFSGIQQEMTEQGKLLLDVKYASQSLSEKEVALASKKAGCIFYENFNIPDVMAQITFTTKNLVQSKGDLSDESANLKFLKLFLTAMGTPFTEISEAEIKIGAFGVTRKNLTSQMLGDLIGKHYRHEAIGQIFSVLIGLDLIKKPVSAVIGGTKKIFHGAYEGITHGIGELSEGIKHQVVRNKPKDESGQVATRGRTRTLYVPLWDNDFGIASTMIDVLKSVTETDINSIHRIRPTRSIQKDRIIRPYTLIESVGNSIYELLPNHSLTEVTYRNHFLLDDVPISLIVITNKSLYVANKSPKWQEEYHTLLENIEYFVVEGNCLRVTSIEKKSSQHGSMVNRDITTRDNRTAKDARNLLQKELLQLGLYKL